MDTAITKITELYSRNFLSLKKPLYWKTSRMYIRLCALSYTLEGTEVSIENLLDAIDYIKKNTKWYSYMRSSRVYTASFLTASNRGVEAQFPYVQDCHDIMKSAGFSSSMYLPIAAYALYATTPSSQYQAKVDRARAIYDRMKKDHPFLTSSDDYSTAILMATSDRNMEDMMQDAENTYQQLKRMGLHTGSGLQFLSQILIFDPALPEEKAKRCIQIAQKLKQMKFRVSSMYYGIIGFLALMQNNWEKAVDDSTEAFIRLRDDKCFASYEKEIGLLVTSSLVCKCYMDRESAVDTKLLRVGVGTTIQAIIAAQAAACAASSGAAAAAASSSS